MIFACVFSCISTIEIYAQKARTAPKPKEGWYLTFELTVKGHGETKNVDNAGEGEIEGSWDIDRTYSGTFELTTSTPTPVVVNKGMSPSEMMAIVNAAPVLWVHSGNGNDLDQKFLMVKVKIKDKVRLKLKDRGEGRSFENTTSLTYWDGNGFAIIDNAVQLLMDKNKSSYNVTIPLQLKIGQYGDENLKISRHKLIERSSFGYGDAPTSEAPPVKYENVALGTLKFPTVIDLLDGGTIHHPNNLPLKLVKGAQGTYDWDSGDVDIDAPLFPDIPESQEGVKVHVYYLLKKMTM